MYLKITHKHLSGSAQPCVETTLKYSLKSEQMNLKTRLCQVDNALPCIRSTLQLEVRSCWFFSEARVKRIQTSPLSTDSNIQSLVTNIILSDFALGHIQSTPFDLLFILFILKTSDRGIFSNPINL